ncbi:MAG: alpha/beta hydrolase [Nocardioides sp.]
MHPRWLVALLATLIVGLVVPVGGAHAVPTARGEADATRVEAPRTASGVVSRGISFSLSNSVEGLFETLGGCAADRKFHDVRARLVGPRRVVEGRAGAIGVNLLVHDAGTGGWFWNLRSHSGHDYATQLARQGQTSVVLDRLGYDASPLRNGNRSCLDAQVAMVHQVVQNLRAGKYDLAGRPAGTGPRPAASHVVVHGHGTGALIAQLEAARNNDVDGLVLMSSSSTSPKQLAVATLREQAATCLGGADFAPFGATNQTFNRLMFASAANDVRRRAAQLRNPTPCGDVATVSSAVLIGRSEASAVDVPVLVLSGSRDARVSPMNRAQARSAFSGSPHVTARVFPGAGSALPLERQAPQVRATVLRWLHGL